MKESDRFAVFIDIDGTLLDNNGRLSERNKNAVLRTREKGHYVFINTGRALGNISKDMFSVFRFFDGYIAGSGCYTYFRDKVISEKNFALPVIKDIVADVLKDPGLWCVLEGKYDIYGINNVPEAWNIRHPILNIGDFSDKYGDPPIEVIAVGKTVPSEMVQKYSDVAEIIQMTDFADFIQPDCSKAFAMLSLAGALGIPASRCIAIGDSENDIPMLQSAGIAVAVENAVPALKKYADLITAANTDDGVAKALEKLL